MNITYIIVDDEKASRETLSGFLNKYCLNVEAIGEASNVEQAYELINELNPHLVFLDVSMPGQNGFALLEKFADVNFEVIFVTAYEEYALKAIKTNAVDYLLKPIGIIELKDAVGRAEQRIKNKKALAASVVKTINSTTSISDKIAVPSREGYIYVDIADIVRCEAERGYTWLYFKNKDKVLVTRTLKEFEDQLTNNKFVRVHHHHLINMKYVTKYNQGPGGQVVMADGSMVEVSQRKRSEFLHQLGIKE